MAVMAADVSSLHSCKVKHLNKPSSISLLLPCLLLGFAGCMVPLQSLSSQGTSMVSNDNFSGVKDINIDFNGRPSRDERSARQQHHAGDLPPPLPQYSWGILHTRSADSVRALQPRRSRCTSTATSARVHAGGGLLRREVTATGRGKKDSSMPQIQISGGASQACSPCGRAHVLWGPSPALWGPRPLRGFNAGACGVPLYLSGTSVQESVVDSIFFTVHFGWSVHHAGQIWWLGTESLHVLYRGPFLLMNDQDCHSVHLLLHCSIPTLQPVLMSSAPRQLLLWRGFDDPASTWVFGSSFFYRRRRHEPHPLVVGMLFLRWLHRPSFHRCYTRSVRPGARVFGASANTPRRQYGPPLRLSRRCCLFYWSQDLNVLGLPRRIYI